MIIKKTLGLMGFFLVFLAGLAQAIERQPLNTGWAFVADEALQPDDISATAWRAIDLPHTWNATDTVDPMPGYYRGAGWYRKIVKLVPGSYRLAFEGANRETRVWVNGKPVGEFVGAYLGFTIPLGSDLRFDGTDELMIRVTNRVNRDLIPSQKADFFQFGGITRDLWLERLPSAYFDWIQVDTPQVSEREAHTHFRFALAGEHPKAASQIAFAMTSPTGDALWQKNYRLPLPEGVSLPVLKQPSLWSPDSPALYQLNIELKDDAGKVLHAKRQSVGYRFFSMPDGKGLLLNGKPLLLRGTHRHEEHAGVGAAMSNEQHRADMAQIKKLGANFVRLAHYPQDPSVYQAADELGLILWDELPWCRGGIGGDAWRANTERLWRAQIRQNRNHPSIFYWSLGNEIYWEADFEGGGDDKNILPFLERLQALTKSLDPSRLTSLRKYYPGADVVDSFSPSIWAGWYGGAFGQYAEALTDAQKKYPAFLHMEYGGSSHRGRHTETPLDELGLLGQQLSVAEAVNQAGVTSVAKDSDWNENYMVSLFDWHLSVSESQPDFAGNAQWAFKDFGTPLRPENPLPYINQKGLVDRLGQPKDAYYVFASYWSPAPVCYIESHSWTVRYGPREGRPVRVYCNTDSAELWLNGKSLGLKQRVHGAYPAHGLVWQVPFVEGSNQLRVQGYNDGESVAGDALALEYHEGKAPAMARVSLSAEDLGDGHWLITAEALGANGLRATGFNDRVYFSVANHQGRLLSDQGHYQGASVIEMANGLAAIRYQAGARAGLIELRSQDLKGVYLEIPR
ncbi:glycoside hydrolase family 2 protein [Simiduia agarivorans]|uniref:Beta-galactosidase/beta-glucuronidase-like protein n=1 Tax=Simiduia agarivorans (strain DSM 21679 / JCM 13881 / BCRC 17597 / SA1) TaxID=1117647 RepID=K4KXZ3_SIMAS|nr:glycoside hydrolase family 2 TIM barrel-domain containing protein [Simiduia agarivorans]AFU98802.1 beta-galactosidase/beta-glucuronidase-like protein [Simiduia agarivorans SA1 = DSM 21679]